MEQSPTPSYETEVHPEVVPVFVVLDMDNTLFASNNFTPYLSKLFNLNGEEQAKLMETVETQSGQGFNLLAHLRKHYGAKVNSDLDFSGEGGSSLDYKRIADAILAGLDIDACRDQLLVPGARKLIDALRQQAVPYEILTTGDEEYQNIKLAVMKRLLDLSDLPAHVVNEGNVPDKSAMIDKLWNQNDKCFVLWNGVAAERVVVVDDKRTNLATQHDGIQCIHIGTNYDLLDLVADVQGRGGAAFF